MAKSTHWLSIKTAKTVLRKSVQALLTTLLILFSPVIFLVYGFLSLYRFIVSKIARHFDPKLGKMVSSLGSIFAAHDIYGNSYTNNIALHVVGKIDRLHVIRAFENLLETSVTSSGEPLYPEMTQKVVTKFGYKFWKNVDNFQMDSHITYLNPENPDAPVTDSELREVIARFGKTPLNSQRSPWQIFVVRNLSSSTNPAVKSAFIMRLHHVMFDGNSILNVFGRLTDNELTLAGPKADQLKNQATKNPILKWLQAILKPVVVCIRGPYELIGQIMMYDNNQLSKTSRENFKNVMRFYECEPIPMEELKAIKNFYGVSLTALHTTLVIRGLKKFMESKNINEEKVHMTFPLPVLNHPDKLRNYFSGGIISCDLSQDDPIKLLNSVQNKYNRFRYAFVFGLPECSMAALRLFGSLPIFLMPPVDNVPMCCTIMHSSFPGPVQLGYFCGFPVVDANVGGSISKPFPTGTLCYSYNGVYKVAVMADASIFTTQEEAELMGSAIYQEFLDFSRKIKENVV